MQDNATVSVLLFSHWKQDNATATNVKFLNSIYFKDDSYIIVTMYVDWHWYFCVNCLSCVLFQVTYSFVTVSSSLAAYVVCLYRHWCTRTRTFCRRGVMWRTWVLLNIIIYIDIYGDGIICPTNGCHPHHWHGPCGDPSPIFQGLGGLKKLMETVSIVQPVQIRFIVGGDGIEGSGSDPPWCQPTCHSGPKWDGEAYKEASHCWKQVAFSLSWQGMQKRASVDLKQGCLLSLRFLRGHWPG